MSTPVQTIVFGKFPVPDLVLVKDYSPGSNRATQTVLRIHIDIDITDDQWKALQTYLETGTQAALQEGYNKVVSNIIGASGSRGHNVVKAAFGV